MRQQDLDAAVRQGFVWTATIPTKRVYLEFQHKNNEESFREFCLNNLCALTRDKARNLAHDKESYDAAEETEVSAKIRLRNFSPPETLGTVVIDCKDLSYEELQKAIDTAKREKLEKQISKETSLHEARVASILGSPVPSLDTFPFTVPPYYKLPSGAKDIIAVVQDRPYCIGQAIKELYSAGRHPIFSEEQSVLSALGSLRRHLMFLQEPKSN